MKKRWRLETILIFALGIMISGCQPKVTISPDQVEAEFSKARAILQEMKGYDLPEKVIAHYEGLVQQAETLKKQGKLELAMAQAKRAGEEASNFLGVWKDQRDKYEELQSLNPPDPLTYHYRNLISQAKTAGEQGKIELALELARQAGDQAGMSLQAWKEQVAKIRMKLDQAREGLETLYPVNYRLIKRYWRDEGLYQSKDFQSLIEEADLLLREIDQVRNMSVIRDPTLLVNAPQEYTKQWGDVRVYEEITPEGKLKTVIDTLPNGTRVKFIRVKLFSPELTFYRIEIPYTGKQGWVLEKYLNVGETGF